MLSASKWNLSSVATSVRTLAACLSELMRSKDLAKLLAPDPGDLSRLFPSSSLSLNQPSLLQAQCSPFPPPQPHGTCGFDLLISLGPESLSLSSSPNYHDEVGACPVTLQETFSPPPRLSTDQSCAEGQPACNNDTDHVD